ncbi:MAG: Gfo/Idh/MocA family oxidoreductase [candidate division WOR-3 bacterium]
MESMEKLGIGIVGVGLWGRNYVRTLAESNACQIFVADVAEKNLKGLQDVRVVSFPELLAHDGIKALIIATPDNTHFPLAVQALEAGKDVLVEKPMALSVEEAEEMLLLAQRRKRIIAIAHTPIYSCSFDLLKSQIEGIAKKDIIRIEAVRTSQGRNNGSDVLWDLACHDLAMAISLFGLPKKAKTIRREHHTCQYKMIFNNDIEFIGIASWSDPPFHREFKVYTRERVYQFQEPIGAKGLKSNLPLSRMCSDFIRCSYTRARPLSDGVLGLNVIKCLTLLSQEGDEVKCSQ